jgi:pimeloyl-ACP methyl ester carboxylesterase
LLIISGLTDYVAKCAWQVNDLADEYYVIAYDNRGAGRSSSAKPGYTVADLADDAVAVLDALHVSEAHVFGFSLGGMTALNVALNRPEKVKRLVLGCTTAGGHLGVYPDPEIMTSLVQPEKSGDRRQDFYDGAWISVSDHCMNEQPDLLDQLAEIAVANPQTSEGYAAQIQAVFTHDVADRLSEIRAPTLVLHGQEDRLIPPENGRLLADNISGAKLILYPQAGHLFFIERAREVNQDIRTFLQSMK